MSGQQKSWFRCGRLVSVCIAIFAISTFLTVASPTGQTPAQRSVAITIDDLPEAIAGTDKGAGELKEMQRINHAIVSALRAHHAPAIGFVNEYKLQVAGERDARAALLQTWLDAELTLGNHTYSHPDLQTTPLEKFEDDFIRGDVVTPVLMAAAGQTERYFRYPFLSTGPTPEVKAAFEAFLKQHGYTNAPITIDPNDWMFNDALGKAIEKKDKKLAAKTKDAYLEYVETVFGYFEGMSRNLFGREIAQILLLHDTELDAEELSAMLDKVEQRGYRFVTLDEALTDPAYATPDKYAGPEGVSWLNRWRISFGQDLDLRHNPDPPKWVIEASKEFRDAHSK